MTSHDDQALDARIAEAKSRVERSGADAAESTIVALITIGTVLSLIGAYFLLFPSGGHVEFLGTSTEVVNMHRLYIGQTSAIVGALFLVTGLRPK